jgi:hypothetical protein
MEYRVKSSHGVELWQRKILDTSSKIVVDVLHQLQLLVRPLQASSRPVTASSRSNICVNGNSHQRRAVPQQGSNRKKYIMYQLL